MEGYINYQIQNDTIILTSTDEGFKITDPSFKESIEIDGTIYSKIQINDNFYWHLENFSGALTISKSVVSIQQRAFISCSGLTSINISLDNPNYALAENIGDNGSLLVQKGTTWDYKAPPIGFLACGEINLTGIDGDTLSSSTYKNLWSVKSWILPSTIKTISDDIFRNDRGLEKINLENITTLGWQVFSLCTNLKSINLNNLVSMEGETFSYCTNLSDIIFGNYLLEIPYSAFYGCSSLTSLDLSKCTSLKSIRDTAFCQCSNLIDISLPSFLTTIGESAFDLCGLISISLPSSLTSIGEYAFSGCLIENIAIDKDNPNFILATNIGDKGQTVVDKTKYPTGEWDFLTPVVGCLAIGDIDLTNITNNSIASDCFLNCTQLKSIKLPDTVTSIGEFAFQDCNSLTSINIENVNSMGIYAFARCGSLKNIVLNNELTSIPTQCFNDCIALEFNDLNLNNIITIGVAAFNNCNINGILSLNNITTIDSNAFMNCKGLNSINFGKTLTAIKSNSFQNCNNISSITFNWETEKEIDVGIANIANDWITNTTAEKTNITIYVPYGTQSLYEAKLKDKWDIANCKFEEIPNPKPTPTPTNNLPLILGITFGILALALIITWTAIGIEKHKTKKHNKK